MPSQNLVGLKIKSKHKLSKDRNAEWTMRSAWDFGPPKSVKSMLVFQRITRSNWRKQSGLEIGTNNQVLPLLLSTTQNAHDVLYDQFFGILEKDPL